MRKVLFATIVAMVLFAVGAFAAALTDVNAEDVASGTGEVGACDETPTVEWTVGEYVPASQDWEIDGAVVTVDAGCEGALVEVVALDDGNNQQGSTGEGTVNASGVAQVSFTDKPLVEPVTNVAVLLDGVPTS